MRIHTPDFQQFVFVQRDGDAVASQNLHEPVWLVCAHPSAAQAVAADDVIDGCIRNDPAAPDHDQVVSGERHFAHQVAGQENRAPLRRQMPDQLPNPRHALRIQTVDRLVENDGLWVTEKCGGDSEALTHAQRESLDFLPGHGAETGHTDDLVHARPRNAVSGGQGKQVVVCGATGVNRFGIK